MQTKLTFSQEDSRASHTAAQGKEKAKKMNAICGQKCLEQYEKFPRVSSWAKMFAASLIGTGEWYSTRCVLSWRLLGIKSRPVLYLRAVSMRHTAESEFGLLPTPTAMDSTNATATMKSTQIKEGSMHSVTLSRLLCTQTAQSGRGNTSDKRGKGNLTDQIAEMELTTSKTSQLNPRFVAEMMGFPPNWTELPFLNGEQNQ